MYFFTVTVYLFQNRLSKQQKLCTALLVLTKELPEQDVLRPTLALTPKVLQHLFGFMLVGWFIRPCVRFSVILEGGDLMRLTLCLSSMFPEQHLHSKTLFSK